MRIILIFLFLLTTSICLGQRNSEMQKLTVSIKKNISFAANYTYSAYPDYNIDSLCLITAKKTVKLMSRSNFSSTYYKSLGLKLAVESKDKTNIKVFNFGYDCGGTRRIITHPIIQWKNAIGKTFAYNLSAKINCNFFEIHQLKSKSRNLYLLIGVEAGDSNCYQGIAYVIEIKGDKLILDFPAFVNRPYLNLCNREFEFDSKAQILTSLLEHASVPVPLTYSLNAQGDYSKDKNANKELENLIAKGYQNEPSIFYLKFNGRQFVKETKR